ncbi:AAA family ATPase [Rhodococcoides kroppenstedtii]|uniref:AAA family ATPase n=1 Tax=Rhodococcoides kroppenstedtii TaxID=293050 RepID=UPI00363CC46B
MAGRNGAGKSSFLQAIAIAIAGPMVARLLAETFSGWIRDGDNEAHAAVKLKFSDEDGFTAGRRPRFEPWAAVEWTRADGPEPKLHKYGIGGNWSPQRGPWAENLKGWFTAGYGPFRRLSPAPTEAQRLMMTPGRPAALASLFREDASLSESVQWLQQVYLQRLEDRPSAQALESLVLRLLNDGLLPEGMRVLKVDSSGLWVVTPEGHEISLTSLSDGYRTVAGLVLDLIKQMATSFEVVDYDESPDGHIFIQHEGIVLIDEIDVHLHVEWQQRIGFWLKSRFPRMQFIVTTHSPFICQAADIGGLVRLSPAWSGRPVAEILIGEEFNRVVNGSADDAVMSDLFGLDSPVSGASQRVRVETAKLEALANTRKLSDAEIEKLISLRSMLPTSQSDRALQALERARRSL